MKDERTGQGYTNMPPERLREMRERCERATPGPWRRWAQPEGVKCFWKDALPSGSVCVESTGTIFALGVAVAAFPGGHAADLDFAAHAREDLPAAIAWGERMQAERGAFERVAATWRTTADKYCDAIAERDKEIERLTAELAAYTERADVLANMLDVREARLAARAPADRPEVDAEDLWTDYRAGRGTVFASDRKAFLAGVAAGRRTREPDMGAADASLEARAKYAATVYDSCGDDATDSSDEQAWIAVVRAVDASRPEPAIERTLNVNALARCARAALRIEVPDVAAWEALPEAERVGWRAVVRCILANTTPASRPRLTEEQADAIALGCLQVREDLQRHAIKRAIQRVDRGETGQAPEPTRAERVAEAQRLRAEARAEAEACTVPMPADLLARYPRSADPPEPDRPAGLTSAMHAAQQRPSVPPDLGPGIGGAPIRIRPMGAPDPRATLRDGNPQKSGGNEQ